MSGIHFVWSVAVKDAINWQLSSGECLAYALIDAALRDAPEHIRNNEEGSSVGVDGDNFTVILFAEREAD